MAVDLACVDFKNLIDHDKMIIVSKYDIDLQIKIELIQLQIENYFVLLKSLCFCCSLTILC